MNYQVTIKRTNSGDADFQRLVGELDSELWNELNESQATYDQYNKVPDLKTVIVLYENEIPGAIGCFKKYNEDTVEIKRMYVAKEFRGKHYSRLVLEALENWARESGFRYAILETSIHFAPARSLYSTAGYHVIENYDQYKDLPESICMRKELEQGSGSSEFKDLREIEYFDFEEEFVERNIRCIPMIVRFKMDRAGIKLSLADWSRFAKEERIELALKPCVTATEIDHYNTYLSALVRKYANTEPTALEVEQNPLWGDRSRVPDILQEKLSSAGYAIQERQWEELTDLQRFALVKLCREKHENKNFQKALIEFKLIEKVEK